MILVLEIVQLIGGQPIGPLVGAEAGTVGLDLKAGLDVGLVFPSKKTWLGGTGEATFIWGVGTLKV
jgi:hypothetical protein